MSGVDSRVIVQTSTSVTSRQQSASVRKTRPSSFHGDDDDNNNNYNVRGGVYVTPWRLAVLRQRRLRQSSTSLPSSSAAPSSAADVVPDISRLDFRPPAFHASWRRIAGASDDDVDHRVWRLSAASGRIAAPRSVVGGLADRGDSAAGQEWRIALLTAAVSCIVAGLLLTLVAVWLRRRALLLTASKL